MIGAVRLNQNVWWYIARSSGLVAWVLVTASVVWGLVYAGRLTRKLPPPAWNLDVHRFLGGLSVSFVIIHIVGLSADKYVNFGLSQILVPFASTWKPGPVAWGVTAMYLLIAVEATSLAMRWLPRKLWRNVHMLTFVLFVMSSIHAWQTGTDIKNPAVRWIGFGLIAAAIATAVLRIIWAKRRQAAKAAARLQPLVPPAPTGPAPAGQAAPTALAPVQVITPPEPEAGPAVPAALESDWVSAPVATARRVKVPRDFFAD